MKSIPQKTKKQRLKFLALAGVFILIMPVLVSWGTFGHERINHAAVLSLPAPLQLFFYNHVDFVTEESTVPDLRKYTLNDKIEYPRHFFDVESFGSLDSLPATLNEAQAKYSEKFLSDNGILPWYMEELMGKLTKAFKGKRKTEILFLAADMGHYVGDAHMPLHTSVNYDGQLSGQKGIHAFWETQLPEMFGKEYALHPSEARYMNDVHKEIWAIIKASHSLVDTVLLADKKLRETYPADKMYKTDSAGNPAKNKFKNVIHSEDYSKKYHSLLHGMIEKQMSKAIAATASLWYTAWVNAGKPDLTGLDAPGVTQRNAKLLKEEKKLWKAGKLSGIESEKEF